MDHNTKSVRIETPADINEEVRSVLMAMKKEQSQQPDRPRTPRKLRISTTSAGTKDSTLQNPVARFLTSQSYDLSDLANVMTSERQERPRTPIYPEVQLLNDARPAADTKAIGFRPSWKCEAWIDPQRGSMLLYTFRILFRVQFLGDCARWQKCGKIHDCETK